MKEITPNIYAKTDYLAPNVGCIRTDEGAVLVDSPFLPRHAADWRKKIVEEKNLDIACLINTDHHFDHIMGNCFLTKNTIAHRLAVKGFEYYLNRENMFRDIEMFFPETLNDEQNGFDTVRIIIPRTVFKDEITLRYGDREIIVKYVGGHCLATVFIYVPSEKVLFAGDNIENERHPAMGSCRFERWLALLREIETMDIDFVVPGHGPLGGKESVTNQIKYFEEMFAFVGSAKKEGTEKDVMAERTVEHMMAFLPVPEEVVPADINRDIIMTGAKRLYDQI